MTDPADLLVWPDTVTAFYADRGYSLRSAATRTTWGYTYRKLQRLHPGKPVGGFTTDDLVAFVTQRGWDTPRWSPATRATTASPCSRCSAGRITPNASRSTRRRGSVKSCASTHARLATALAHRNAYHFALAHRGWQRPVVATRPHTVDARALRGFADR